ncbi:MAG: hypothetical protein AAF768_03125 [Pseudomonadota bacterium]
MQLISISPLFISLELKSGIDPRLSIYDEVLKALPAKSDEITAPNRDKDPERIDFSDLKQDDYDLRLLVWKPKPEENAPTTEFHIYSNGICSVVVHLNLDDTITADQATEISESTTKAEISRYADRLNALLSDVYNKIPDRVLDTSRALEPVSESKIGWTSRAIVVEKDWLERPPAKTFVTEWLSETLCPEDAERILKGEISKSVTWVNYLVVNTPDFDAREMIRVVRLAQFFFAAQQELNMQTQRALIEASLEKNVRKANEILSRAREKMQHLTIQFNVQRSFLRRSRKLALDELLAAWDFDDLVKNGERMVKASTSKIDQIVSARSERSAVITDLILAVIAFLIVIEVSLYFTEYSRQLMSNPALEYNDNGRSWLLSAFANFDTDSVLIGSALSLLTLVGLYAYWKLRK